MCIVRCFEDHGFLIENLMCLRCLVGGCIVVASSSWLNFFCCLSSVFVELVHRYLMASPMATPLPVPGG